MDATDLTGTVTLRNTKQYPFNDSTTTIALDHPLSSQAYSVHTEILSASGEAGDIVVSGRAVNGFKLAFTGSAEKVEVRYRVLGGVSK
jgi:hypothetical protein